MNISYSTGNIFPVPIHVFDIKDFDDYDAIVISDYNKGFLNEDDIKSLIKQYPISFIDSKKIFDKWIDGTTFLKINEY